MANPSVKKLESHDKAILIASGVTAIVGLVLIIIGFVLRFGRGFDKFMYWAVQEDDFLELERLEMIFGLFTAVALILILLSGAAVYGILRQNIIVLKMYAAVIALMVLVQLVTGLLAFMYRDDINNLISDERLYKSLNELKQTFINDPNSSMDTIESNFWEVTQEKLECCGVRNSTDWLPWDPTLIRKFNCFQGAFNKGCEKEIRSRLSTDAMYFGVAAMGFLLVEVIASFLAGWRAFNIAESHKPANPYAGFVSNGDK